MEFLDIRAEGSRYKKDLYELYEEAFPPEEKKPLSLMEDLCKEGKMEMLALTDGQEFIGLAVNMLSEQTALLDYFAIVKEKRSDGYGGKAVRSLIQRFENKKYIFEIEMQDPNAENAVERERRKRFYLKNGLKETGVFANVYQTDFELITPDGVLEFDAYVKFLLEILGEEGVRKLNPCRISEIR